MLFNRPLRNGYGCLKEGVSAPGSWGGLPTDKRLYCAPIPPPLVVEGDAEWPATDFNMIGVEAELGYRFRQPLAPRDEPYSDEEVLAALEGVFVTIEVVDTRLKDREAAGMWWILADNQINGALVIGEGIADWRSVDASSQAVELRVNGEMSIALSGSNPMGDPVAMLPWWVNHRTGNGEGVEAGDLVTTGSWTGMIFVEPGTEVVAHFPGIGEARARFKA